MQAVPLSAFKLLTEQDKKADYMTDFFQNLETPKTILRKLISRLETQKFRHNGRD